MCDEAERARIEAEARAKTLKEVAAKVAGLIDEAGGMCRVPDDAEDPICETHSEILFDGSCEDQPRQLIAVLAAVDSLREASGS